jgi:hypothetical protein
MGVAFGLRCNVHVHAWAGWPSQFFFKMFFIYFYFSFVQNVLGLQFSIATYHTRHQGKLKRYGFLNFSGSAMNASNKR